MRQQQTWHEDSVRTLQSVLKRYQIPPEVGEAGMAAGVDLDYDETLAQIQAELEATDV